MAWRGQVLTAGSVFSAASFKRPAQMVLSAWTGHAPFAFWLVEALRPRRLVELGTHHGFSFFCFCQQVAEQHLGTECFAVDTWSGDEHAGHYGEEVFDAVRRHQAAAGYGFATLVRSRFDDAVTRFKDGSIDLLHIDGRHYYEDVRHDFETWLPKMSDRGVVLFHDTQVRERDFGVHRLWTEIAGRRPHFAFAHAHGLGVLGVGSDRQVAALPLFALDEAEAEMVRGGYARLGEAVAGGPPLRRNEPCPCGSARRFKHCHGRMV